MYYCRNCKEEFDEPKVCKISYEEYYGCEHLFNDTHITTIEKCIYCGSEEFEEMEKCNKCGEYCRECDFVDTDEMVGGGIGYICYDCARDCDLI